jgi:hypothetical protein
MRKATRSKKRKNKRQYISIAGNKIAEKDRSFISRFRGSQSLLIKIGTRQIRLKVRIIGVVALGSLGMKVYNSNRPVLWSHRNNLVWNKLHLKEIPKKSTGTIVL